MSQLDRPVYLDYHATTPVDPRVAAAMWPYFVEEYGNSGSLHVIGQAAQAAVEDARLRIARAIGAGPREIVFTSGATESNNLALKGVCNRPRRRGNHVISVQTEHRAVLDPLAQLAAQGIEVTLLPVDSHGFLSLDTLAAALRADTLLVSVMLANNEIGVIQPLAEMGALCRQHNVLLHCDATQAVGKLPLDVTQLQVDLLSFSAHKMCGPKGIGALYVRKTPPPVRLQPLIDGGGQEGGLRSGTLPVPLIVGFATALELSLAELPHETARLASLRQRLYDGLCATLPGVSLNGPPLTSTHRLAHNLNVRFAGVDGSALLTNLGPLCVSSGSACTSVNPEPSHVLLALGLTPDDARSSLRFGLGRFTTEAEIDWTVGAVSAMVRKLRCF